MADIAEIKKFLIEIKPEDITAELIESKFCNHYDPETGKLVKPEVDFQTEFILKKGEYLNKEDVKTNVGQFIVNKVLSKTTKIVSQNLQNIENRLND